MARDCVLFKESIFQLDSMTKCSSNWMTVSIVSQEDDKVVIVLGSCNSLFLFSQLAMTV